MRYILVTGANGEIGHALIKELANKNDGFGVIGLDKNQIPKEPGTYCEHFIQGDVTDADVIRSLEGFDIARIYHLAALLSSSAERDPFLAHHVNVNGALSMLSLARRIGDRTGSLVTFLFPSTIAVYGMDSLVGKAAAGAIKEESWLYPRTMYGINKLYCEQVGAYMAMRFGQLQPEGPVQAVDFRALRYPGIISAFTEPTGGTSDYAPEMIHAAARGEDYECFVRPDSRIPFMVMPDAVKAIMSLADADPITLKRRVYNVGSFAPTAQEIAESVKSAFPGVSISYEPHPARQAIVDSWCADVDDTAARVDWNWQPDYDMVRAFGEYLIPNIRKVYEGAHG